MKNTRAKLLSTSVHLVRGLALLTLLGSGTTCTFHSNHHLCDDHGHQHSDGDCDHHLSNGGEQRGPPTFMRILFDEEGRTVLSESTTIVRRKD